MSGQFIGFRHVCQKPSAAEDGRVWQCECGQRWEWVATRTLNWGSRPHVAEAGWWKYDGAVEVNGG